MIESVSEPAVPRAGPAPTTSCTGRRSASTRFCSARGARVGLLATAGFRDVLEIRRGSREEMLNLWWRPPTPLVPRHLRLPIRERMLADGTVLTGLEAEDVAAAARAFDAAGVDAVAVAFINSYRNPEHELLAAERASRARVRGRDLALTPRLARVPGVRAHLDDRDRRLRPQGRRRLPGAARRRARGPGIERDPPGDAVRRRRDDASPKPPSAPSRSSSRGRSPGSRAPALLPQRSATRR